MNGRNNREFIYFYWNVAEHISSRLFCCFVYFEEYDHGKAIDEEIETNKLILNEETKKQTKMAQFIHIRFDSFSNHIKNNINLIRFVYLLFIFIVFLFFSIRLEQTDENDLPICSPNAVCSKIDLYETPWIERQCRCPKPNYAKHYRTVYHMKEILRPEVRNSNYRHVIEQKVKIADEENLNNDYNLEEEQHIKNLMRKLGVVYNAEDVANDEETSNSASHRSTKRRFNNANLVKMEPKFRHASHHDIPRLGGCPSAISDSDGHTITDKTRLYKLCEPVHKLPLCR